MRRSGLVLAAAILWTLPVSAQVPRSVFTEFNSATW